MTNSDTPSRIAWLIDDDERQLRTYRAMLERALPANAGLTVKAVGAFAHLQDYLGLLRDSRTTCIIADQRLKETGVADHTGIELARYLRALNDKLPIYILTNFAGIPEEFAGSEWSVEDIISKRDIGDPKYLAAVVARLLRRIGAYADILGQRESRFRNLVRKSLTESLTKAEMQEMEGLRYFRSSALLAEELAVQDRYAKAEKLIDRLTKLAREKPRKRVTKRSTKASRR